MRPIRIPLRRLSTVPALAAALALGACGGEEAADAGVAEETEVAGVEAPYHDWDVDEDRLLAVSEFGDWSRERGIFTRWDADADEGLAAGELGAGAGDLWDADADGTLGEEEWRAGARDWYGDRDYGAFADWDANADATLDDEELGAGFESTGLFGAWDADASERVDESEFNEALFGLWDDNEDGTIDGIEWSANEGTWAL